ECRAWQHSFDSLVLSVPAAIFSLQNAMRAVVVELAAADRRPGLRFWLGRVERFVPRFGRAQHSQDQLTRPEAWLSSGILHRNVAGKDVAAVQHTEQAAGRTQAGRVLARQEASRHRIF